MSFILIQSPFLRNDGAWRPITNWNIETPTPVGIDMKKSGQKKLYPDPEN